MAKGRWFRHTPFDRRNGQTRLCAQETAFNSPAVPGPVSSPKIAEVARLL
jgi:hypothetical protein